MRTMRWFIAGLVTTAALSATASAQSSRFFDDSWFWGVKSGVASFSPTLGGNETAATYGAEWLITRTHAGLYVSFDQAKVSTTSAVLDANSSDGVRPVSVSKLNRVGFAALAFPKRFGNVRPYAGLGLSVDLVGSARPMVADNENGVDDAVFERIDEQKSQAAVLGMAGVQFQVQRAAVFVQASVVPGQSGFLLGENPLAFFEAGLRYNFGSSREGR
jgi:hypothetical protein